MRNIFLWIIVLLTFTLACQQDEILFETGAEYQSELKNSTLSPGTYTGTYSGGEWQISLPDPLIWNNPEITNPRCIIFYAHGMVDPVDWEPVQLPADEIGGELVEDIITGMNMGYATTSYRDNGLIVLNAIEDIRNLVDIVDDFFENEHPEYFTPDFYFLGGPSEGGLVSVKTIEKYKQLFDGAVSICGPIGNFYHQLQYNGDFHVLFNYFFEEELKNAGMLYLGYPVYLGNPQDGVNESVMDAWKFDNLKDIIAGILASKPDSVRQLLKCTRVTVDINDPLAVGTAIIEMLRFNVMLTNDVLERMNGVPYNNKYKWYSGSDNDWHLNRNIQRILDPSFRNARKNIKKYETSGNIKIPLVTIHTTGDHVIPFWHNPLYRLKIFMHGNSLLHTGIPVNNYGHATIEKSHVMAALAILITKASLMDSFEVTENLFESTQELDSFKKILQDHSIQVDVN